MARRALRRLKTNSDLSQSLFLMSDLLPSGDETVRPPLERIFGTTTDDPLGRPLELEIGSGKGLFIRLAAAQYPDHDFLGIEAANHYAEYCAQKIVIDGLTNAKMISGDAAVFLRDGIPDDCLFAVHVYFPDPWWKRKQRKRRVMRADVLRWIYQKLRPGGHLHFWTDVSEYFVSTVSLIAKTTTFERLETPLAPDVPQTHFERRTRLAGELVYRSLYVKPLIPTRVPIETVTGNDDPL